MGDDIDILQAWRDVASLDGDHPLGWTVAQVPKWLVGATIAEIERLRQLVTDMVSYNPNHECHDEARRLVEKWGTEPTPEWTTYCPTVAILADMEDTDA